MGRTEQAADVIVERHYPWMLRYARLMLGRDDDAHEAIRRAFADGLGDPRSLKDGPLFSDRLMQLLILRCRELALRSLSAQRQKSHGAHDNSAIIAALPSAYRQILELRDRDNLSFKEIARLTGLRQMTLRKRVSRARKLLVDFRESGADKTP